MSDYEDDTPQPNHDSFTRVPPPLPQTRTSTKAVWSLLLGILGLGLWLVAAIPAIVLASIAKREIKKDARLEGNSLANGGLILGCVGLVIAPFFLLAILPALFQVGSSAVPSSDTERIVHLHLSGALGNSRGGDTFAMLSEPPPSLGSILDKLKTAREDDAVLAVVVTVDSFSAGYAHVEELHSAFRALDAAGKKVYAHMEEAFLTTSTYTLLSGASEINGVPTAFINLTGIYMEGLFLKDGLDKLGVEADIVHMGDYKSAGEIVMRSEPSDEASEAMNWLLDGLYESSIDLIATSRGTDTAAVRRLIDGGPYTAERALEAGLVDSLMYLDELLESLKEEYGEDIYIDNHYDEPIPPDIDFNSPLAPIEILFADYTMPPSDYVGESVAIVSVAGNIVPGYSDPSALSESDGAYSGDIRKALEQATADETVKAIVLRVDSPGGSVTASEIILRAVMEAKSKKPLVVSMGNLAASGGYYVSCDADMIFANETTITGSIGVVGGKIVTTGLWDKLGVNWHPYQRGTNADWVSSAQPFTETQRARVLSYMGDTYTIFKDHVVAGRGDKLTKPIDDMAGGRVFTGKQALDLGLVDEIGGLYDAIAYAAELVDLDEYDVRTFPGPEYLDEAIINFLFGGGDRPSDLAFTDDEETQSGHATRGAIRPTPDPTSMLGLLSTLDPQRSQTALQLLHCATQLDQESVLVITPQFFAMP